MNELLRSVLTRRSVHKFSGEQISERAIGEIIEAGKFVSNPMKDQIWYFTVIQNRELLERISEQNRRFIREYAYELFKDNPAEDNFSTLKNAPTVIIISGKCDSDEMQDAANATFGNMMLAAERCGVSACWTHSIKLLLGAPSGKDLLHLIGISQGYVPLCAGAFGYKETVQTPETTVFKDGIVHIIK